MTELETLERAKMYMEKLANGINPIDDSAVPDTDVINNMRLSRCFFYVSDVLRQVIENGGVTPQKKLKKEPFALPAEKCKNFAFSDVPITISDFVKRINDLVADENMIHLTTSVMMDWLVSIDALQIELTAEGRSAKRPTDQGCALGLSVDVRTGMNGPYSVVVYNRDAQQFLLDNMDGAIAMYRQKTQNQGQPWTPEHDRCLLEMHQKDVDIKQIAIALKRNRSAVRGRLRKLGAIQ